MEMETVLPPLFLRELHHELSVSMPPRLEYGKGGPGSGRERHGFQVRGKGRAIWNSPLFYLRFFLDFL
jgi:hypothetical protein